MSAMSRQNRKYQLRHKRVGLCCDGSRPVASGTLFCELHRRKRNVENREWQRKRFKRKIRYRNAESYRFTGGATLMSAKKAEFAAMSRIKQVSKPSQAPLALLLQRALGLRFCPYRSHLARILRQYGIH